VCGVGGEAVIGECHDAPGGVWGIAAGGEYNCVLAPDGVGLLNTRRSHCRAAVPGMLDWPLANLPVEVDAA
jgi:hypothetical protein